MTGASLATRVLGRTQLRVSELGLGTATLGNLFHPMSDQVAHSTLSEALGHGFTYVDTAPYYGFGLSERRVGDALRGRRGIVLSTKVGRLLKPDIIIDGRERHGFHSPVPFKPVFDYSYDAILRSYEDSLQRLGLARVDILYIHDIGSLTHGGEDGFHFDALTRGGGLRALGKLRESGAIGAFGVGANEVEACIRVMDCAPLDVILLAGRYTLLQQGALSTLFPKCEAVGTSVVIGGPYNSGILATGVRRPGAQRYDYIHAPAAIIERVGGIEDICTAHGVPLAAAALQFPLAHPVVASVIPGLDHPHRVAETVELYRTPIPADLWSALRSAKLIDASAPTPHAVGAA
jgi:D-threo-aldose 1-dehydrogenase